MVLYLQSHANDVAELLCEHFVFHLVPAISYFALSFVEFGWLFSLEVHIRELIELIFKPSEVVIILIAKVPLVDVLTQSEGLQIVHSEVVHLIVISRPVDTKPLHQYLINTDDLLSIILRPLKVKPPTLTFT